MNPKTVVLLSGGIDSAVLLANLANTDGTRPLHAVSVHYGQRHERELWSAVQVAHYYGATHEVVTLPPAALAGSALTGGAGEAGGAPTVVPGRNLVLVSLAVAAAARRRAGAVYIACHAGDRAVYPDCRAEFVAHLAAAVGEGYGVEVVAPFLHMQKRAVVALGRFLQVPFDLTWSCYDPQGLGEPRSPLGAYGRPCGRCGACVCRAEATA